MPRESTSDGLGGPLDGRFSHVQPGHLGEDLPGGDREAVEGPGRGDDLLRGGREPRIVEAQCRIAREEAAAAARAMVIGPVLEVDRPQQGQERLGSVVPLERGRFEAARAVGAGALVTFF